MFKKLSKIKYKRACIIALFEEKKINEAIKQCKKYTREIFYSFDFPKNKIKELENAKNAFLEVLKPYIKECLEKRKYDEAIKLYHLAYKINSKDKENMTNYIALLEKLKQYDLAIEIAKNLLKIEKNTANYRLIARLYRADNDYCNSIKYFEKIIEITKCRTSGPDYTSLGCNYFDIFRKNDEKTPNEAKKALKYFLKALETEPDNKTYLKNVAIVALKNNLKELEAATWKHFVQLGGATEEEKFAYSAAALRVGDFENWQKYYDTRFTKSSNRNITMDRLKKPVWQGEDISNKTLLVHYEQGFGDTFTMWGYMSRLSKLAKKIIFISQDSVADLLKDNDYGIEVIAKKDADLEKLKYDINIASMSLPKAMKLNRENISVKGDYMKAPEKLTKEFKEKYFNTDKLKIGIAFKGNDFGNQKRDIPLSAFLALEKLKNVQLYCLTLDIPDNELKIFKRNKIINIAENFKTFSETAATIENCDIIISSDCGLLNLAGALGKYTLGIFNHFYEFRWYDLNEKDCGWYNCVKPIINNEYDDWNLSLKRATEEIKKFQKERK